MPPKPAGAGKRRFGIEIRRVLAMLGRSEPAPMLPMPWIACLLLSLCLALAGGSRAAAATIDSDYAAGDSLSPPVLNIYIRGEFQNGDIARLRRVLARHADKAVRLAFHFDSPGGALVEGIEMGKLIAALPNTTQSHVGGRSAGAAICASACVYAYLGAKFRYLAPRAKIGVHKFYMEGKAMRGGEALALSQDLSGMIVSYLRTRGVDAEFFQDIISSAEGGIYWVPHDRLASLKVITQDVRGQTVDYRNLRGQLMLNIEQDALVGYNAIQLGCGVGGITGTAFLQEPDNAFEGRLMLHSGGVDYPVLDQRLVSRRGQVSAIGFRVPAPTARVVMRNASIGARVFDRHGRMAFGFYGDVYDTKIGETFRNCAAVISIRNLGAAP